MFTQEESELAELIKDHVNIGYELLPGGVVDPTTIFITTLAAAHVVLHKLREPMQRIVDHFDARSELYTNDADLAAGMAAIARSALSIG